MFEEGKVHLRRLVGPALADAAGLGVQEGVGVQVGAWDREGEAAVVFRKGRSEGLHGQHQHLGTGLTTSARRG
jgi:hypothetical protein